MLDRVTISAYRCLRQVAVPLKPLTILIGPNNTGKTSFLSAIQLLGKAGHSDATLSQTDRWLFSLKSSPSIIGKTIDGRDVHVDAGPTHPQRGGAWQWNGATEAIAPVNLFDCSILQPAMASDGAVESAGIPQIDDKASNLPAYLDSLLRKDRDRFFHVRDTLRRMIPGFHDLNIQTPSAQSRRIDLVLENGIEMDAKLASYGVRLMIFFVALANHPNPPSTILLEEPETGVHPKRLSDIVDLLMSLSEGKLAERPTQVILTTHAPYLLDCIDPKKHQVLVFQRESDGACTAQPVDTDRLKLFLDEFMLGEVWVNQEEAGLVAKVQ